MSAVWQAALAVIESLRCVGTMQSMQELAEAQTETASIPVVQRALRVALVTETWPPEVNGVASTIARIAEGLRQQGHALQVVRPQQAGETRGTSRQAFPDAAGSELIVRGLPIPRYPQLRLGLPSRSTLVAHWRHERPDVVHLVTEGPLGWSALRAARQLRLPVVSDFRTNFHAYSSHYGLAWLRGPITAYLRRFHNLTGCTMVPTPGLAAELAGSGFTGLRVIARGVDAQRFDPSRRDPSLRALWGAWDRRPVALYVGRLAREKNLDTVIDAWRAMQVVAPATRLVLVGDGPDRDRLRAICPEAVFAGVQRGDALAAYYASADIFLFASMTETFGNVVPEAMASGLAVVAYRHAAAGELIRHGHNGLLAPLDEPSTFVRLAARVAGDAAERTALQREARRTAGGLDWQRIVEAIEFEYRIAMARESGIPALGAAALARAG